MDLEKAGLVVCISLTVIIGINAAIYLSFKRGNQATMVDLFRKASTRARNPWQPEDEALQELSKLVAQLQSREDSDETNAGDRDG